jgi:AraC-like DNA-binding protein
MTTHTTSPHRTFAVEADSRAASNPSAVARLEDVIPDESRSFRVFEYKGPGFKRGWHYHPEVELIVFLESSGPLFVGDHMGTYGPGEVLLFGANLPHELRYVHGPVRCLWIHFSLDWFSESMGDLPECAAVSRMLAHAARGLRFDGTTAAQVTERLVRMPALDGIPYLTGFLDILGILATSSEVKTLSSAGFTPALDEHASARVQKIHEYVFNHFKDDIDHGELARLVGLSRSALSHFFRRTTGRTLTDFINEVRIGHACQLLINTTLNVSEIAFTCGFESLSHFNNIFRRSKTLNPTQFRAQRAPGSEA